MLPLYGAVLVAQLNLKGYIMLIKRESMLSGIIHEMDLPVTNEQLAQWLGGALVQDVFPHLNADQREFLMTGIMPDEWDGAFGDDE